MIRSRSQKRTALPAIAGILALGLLLAGCSSDDTLAQQWSEASDKGFIAGDGTTTSIAPDARTGAAEFTGVTEYGEPVSSADLLGSVSVINFWYAGCAPCRAEAGTLANVHEEFLPEGVQFLGVNTRDQEAQALQFAEEFSIEYPSVMDAQNNRATQRAFAGEIPLNAVPTTLVLDQEGRVAHRVLGQLADEAQLRVLIKETLAEAA